MNKKERLIQAFSLLLVLSMAVSACASEAPATSVVMPEFLATATAQAPVGESMPQQEATLPDLSSRVLGIQGDCREYLESSDSDVCMGLVTNEEQNVWTGVLSSEYQPGSTVGIYGYTVEDQSFLLASGTVDPDLTFEIVQSSELNARIITLYVGINSVDGNVRTFLSDNKSGDYRDGSAVWLFEKLKQESPSGIGGPNT